MNVDLSVCLTITAHCVIWHKNGNVKKIEFTMKDKENNTNVLDNYKINVKLKLSALWTAVMFIYVYADIKVLFQPGTINAINIGEIGGMQINQMFLFISAAIMIIPCLMIFLSLVLKPKLNKLINIFLGIIYTVIIISTYLISGDGEIWVYYILYNIVEVVLTFMIILYAWMWPRKLNISELEE